MYKDDKEQKLEDSTINTAGILILFFVNSVVGLIVLTLTKGEYKSGEEL
ncbi:Uncharacterised protein [Mycoplasmopsis californica]|uniref:Uncharacterized protein n=1 Tax=Mycoplasmopsis equigenitalium TaxID=114883 RepID=A0ABY5J3P9_9BACT|nr:hypothetical protein [Mycoplasmopsis equigenitalium]UUD37151.1 hypothetical protein NPA09_01075 [Mycoplasmopsis equigenitalium]VEU69543.1 Uncharacterised protein [Mycoplasmopsis californica]